MLLENPHSSLYEVLKGLFRYAADASNLKLNKIAIQSIIYGLKIK
jgi:hypothetical protein